LGTKQMLSILNRITGGEGQPEDIDLLGEICAAVKQGSLCGLGQTAPNPVLTTIRYFRDEYESHIVRKKCPAVVCRGLVEAPCKHTCPAGIDVPRYVRFIAAGRYADALNVIREKIPFPSVCGHICFHPCETKCRRGQLDDPVAVRALKRAAAEYGSKKRRRRPPRAAATGKKVAVIGSGPAGLTAAFYLGKLGHEVTVFERERKAGGTLRTGIPAFRLPREVIDREIAEIKKESGIRIRTKTDVRSADTLLREGFDAVLVSHGAQKGLTMGIEGEDLPGVYDCLSFLRRVNGGEKVDAGERVAVVGGGNAAMDAARTALRCGAGEVTIVYRRTRKDMPSGEEELEEALEEGVGTEFLTNPTRIEKRDTGLVIHCVRMEPGPIDASGRPRPVPVEGSDFEMAFDTVIMAIGQTPEDIPTLGCLADKRGRIQIEEETLETSRPGVFAAGDAVTGPASVIEAIAAGRRAARSIDRFLGGAGDIEETLAPAEEDAGEMIEEQEERRRTGIPRRPAAERVANGGAVELVYSAKDAVAEAGRCLRCDLEEMEED
jgi:NADH-quinone oxidoreductase subunit F